MKPSALFHSLCGTILLFLSAERICAADFNIANGDMSALSIAIQQANINDEDDTINLAAEGLYIANGPFSSTEAALPALDGGDYALIINGNGATLRRSTAPGTPNFRLLTTSGPAVTINRLIIHNGRLASGSGGGISNFGDLILTKCIVVGNMITGASNALGGGIMNQANARLVLNDCIVSANSVSATTTAHGGGIYNFGTHGDALRVIRSTICGNTVSSGSGGRAGGVYNRGVGTFINSTVSGNTGSGPGGGIYHHAFGGEPLAIVNCTIANNTATAGNGGGIYDGSAGGLSTVSVLNTIIATNTASGGPDVFQGAGPIASQGHNLIGKTDGSSGWVASDLTGTSMMPRDPMLGPLESDFMHPLLAGSAAIDAADDAVLAAPHNLVTDQRLVPRSTGAHVDIGAFELEPGQGGLAPVVTTTIEHNDGICGVADCSLGEAVAFANSNPDATTITFKVGLSGAITTRSTPSGLELVTPMTIEGPGARMLTISGSHVSRIFAVTIDTGPITVSGLTFASGYETLTGGGGAITAFAPTTNPHSLTLNSCLFRNNFTTSSGGAIYSSGPVVLNNCTFSGNVADGGFGGATHAFGDSFQRGGITAINCTFSGNRAVGGGAVSNKASGRTTTTLLRNCTVSGNIASLNGTNTGGGLINQGTATHSRIRIENTIVAANTADDGHPDVVGTITSLGYNLVGQADPSTGLTNGTNNDQVGAIGSPINPQLGALQDNGGPTDTRALLAGSTAINAANSANAPARDQRYYSRVGASDIGAFEFEGEIAPLAAVSRKNHGGTNFDIALPVTGTPGVECRNGGASGNHSLVISFATAVTVTNAFVASGTGSVSNFNVSDDIVTVNLTGVSNAQNLTVRLTNVSDGSNTNNVNIPISVLNGDTTGNGSVNSSDIGQTKSRSGQTAAASNFRSDVTVSGSINASDIGLVKSKSGTSLP